MNEHGRSPGKGSANAFARSEEKVAAHLSRRNAFVAERKHQQEDRILSYVASPRASQSTVRASLDEQRQLQGDQRAQARYSEAIQTEQNMQYASAVESTYQARAGMRAQQQAVAAEANRRAMEDKTQRKQQERVAEQQMDTSSFFIDRFGTSLR